MKMKKKVKPLENWKRAQESKKSLKRDDIVELDWLKKKKKKKKKKKRKKKEAYYLYRSLNWICNDKFWSKQKKKVSPSIFFQGG